MRQLTKILYIQQYQAAIDYINEIVEG